MTFRIRCVALDRPTDSTDPLAYIARFAEVVDPDIPEREQPARVQAEADFYLAVFVEQKPYRNFEVGQEFILKMEPACE